MIGSSPDLPNKIGSDDNLPIQYDFRSVYKSVLKNWFGVSSEKLNSIINQGPNEEIELFS
jgi:uncharacterized protein (DUF1501 family)